MTTSQFLFSLGKRQQEPELNRTRTKTHAQTGSQKPFTVTITI